MSSCLRPWLRTISIGSARNESRSVEAARPVAPAQTLAQQPMEESLTQRIAKFIAEQLHGGTKNTSAEPKQEASPAAGETMKAVPVVKSPKAGQSSTARAQTTSRAGNPYKSWKPLGDLQWQKDGTPAVGNPPNAAGTRESKSAPVPLTNDSVVKLVKSGVSEETILPSRTGRHAGVPARGGGSAPRSGGDGARLGSVWIQEDCSANLCCDVGAIATRRLRIPSSRGGVARPSLRRREDVYLSRCGLTSHHTLQCQDRFRSCRGVRRRQA